MKDEPRRTTRRLLLGGVPIGGGAFVSIQSMVRASLDQPERVLEEIRRLDELGCQVVRAALVHRDQLTPFAHVVGRSPIPLVADVHYPFDLALGALQAGAAGVRVNPLIAWGHGMVQELAKTAEQMRAVIRVGINAGRWPSGEPLTAEGLVGRVLERVDRLAQAGADQIKCSVKSSSPALTLESNRLLARKSPWPIHLGLTEAGPGLAGAARSASVMAVLLAEGIGDTIRVSLSGPAVDEVIAAREILRALGLVRHGVEIISCPGCGRAHADVAEAASFVQQALAKETQSLQVAVMGCEINGPGEAAGADLGIAATKAGWVLFAAGRRIMDLSWQEGPARLVDMARRELSRRKEQKGSGTGS